MTRTLSLPTYENPALPAEQLPKELLARTALTEKSVRMMCVCREAATRQLEARADFDFENAKATFKKATGLAAAAGANRPDALSNPLHP